MEVLDKAMETSFCNGVYEKPQPFSTPQAPKKNMATDTRADFESFYNPSIWLNRKRFASLPRSASSSRNKLLTSTTGAGTDSCCSGATSSISLNDSPRHLVTYVTSSMETIPVEMNQDIPDVML